MDIKIYVAYHKKSDIIRNNMLVPIQVGREKSSVILEEMIGDNTGDNISEKNKQYCELTATYWAWKNAGADYVGICHYRRFFTFEKLAVFAFLNNYFTHFIKKLKRFFGLKYRNSIRWDSRIKYKSISEFTASAYRFTEDLPGYICKNNPDIISLKSIKFNALSLIEASNSFYISILRDIISDKYPDMLKTFDKECHSDKIIPANMVIMKKSEFDNYAEFLFSVLEEYESVCIKKNLFIDLYKEEYVSRMLGYMGEILTSIYVRYMDKKQHKIVKYIHFSFVKNM